MGWKDAAKKEVQSRASANTFKFKEGENVIRLLPHKKGTKFPPYKIYSVHPNVGPRKRWLPCGKKEGEGECWLCDKKIPALLEDGRSNLVKKAEEISATEQLVMQFAWLEGDEWMGPKPWFGKLGKGKAFANRLLSFVANPKIQFDDPEEGRNVLVEKLGTGLDTTYADLHSEDEASVVPEKILSKIKSFGEIIGVYSEDKQKATYAGREDEVVDLEDEPADEDEEPKPKSKKKAEAEDEEPEPEDEDEEPKPKSKKKSKAEDEEPEPEDEDEEPKPKGKKKPKDEDEESEPEPEDEDEEPKPKGKKKPKDEDEDEEPPQKRKRRK